MKQKFGNVPTKTQIALATLFCICAETSRSTLFHRLGETEDIRMRDKEFSAKDGFTKNELLAKLESTVDEAVRIIEASNEERLLKTYSVQGFDLSGIGIIIHVTEHYSYHTGQIAFWIKQLKDKDLGFYSGVNLNVKNKN